MGLGYLAGVLSTLSPCVLPLIPIVFGAAVAAHRFGAFALTAGLVFSFTSVGIFVGTLGAALGLDEGVFRNAAALILIAFGVVMLSGQLQRHFSTATAGISNLGQKFLTSTRLVGLRGQFVAGAVLGLIWSPCVGPTLGAASTLASRGENLGQVALLMVVFGLGAGTPLLVLGSLSRSTMQRVRGKLLSAGAIGKTVLGALAVFIGVSLLSGLDRRFEAWALNSLPDRLIEITTTF